MSTTTAPKNGHKNQPQAETVVPETTVRPELQKALDAAAPKTLTARERYLAEIDGPMTAKVGEVVKKFATTGIQPVLDMPAHICPLVKGKGDAATVKNAEKQYLEGLNVGDITGKRLKVLKANHVLESKQGTLVTGTDGVQTWGITASKDTTMPEEAAEVVAAKIFLQ